MSARWTAALACPHAAGRVAIPRPADRAPGAAEVQLALDLLGREHARRSSRETCPIGRRFMDAAQAAWGEFSCELFDLELRLEDLARQLDSIDDAGDVKARIEAGELHDEWIAVGRQLAAARAERTNGCAGR